MIQWTDLTAEEHRALEVVALGRTSGMSKGLQARLIELKLATKDDEFVALTPFGIAVLNLSMSRCEPRPS